jgi:cyanophycinase
MSGRYRHALCRGLFCAALASGAACATAAPQFASTATRSPQVRGTLFIVGGGAQPDELVKDFIALAGGPGKARIAILPMATSDAVATGAEKKAQLDSMGADSFVVNFTRAQADDDSLVRRLSSATGIWFPGGDQTPLAAALRGSAALRAIQDRYRSGAVIGGTSAGAAVMSDSMITGNQFWPGMSAAVDSPSFSRIGRRTIEVTPGLGFLHGAIVDQHFIRRQRENRLISVVLERPSLLGVGIDEGTALEVGPDGKWTVLGRSAVIVLDARNARITSRGDAALGGTNLKMSVLPAGSTYDPASGEGRIPQP